MPLVEAHFIYLMFIVLLNPLIRTPECKLDSIEFGGDMKLSSPPDYKKTDKIATRAAYGTALKKMGEANEKICGFDGDTKER